MNSNSSIDADVIFQRLRSERASEMVRTAHWDRPRTRELLMIVTRGPLVWAL